MQTHAMVDSPLGPLTLVARDGALAGLYFEDHRRGLSGPPPGVLAPAGFDEVRRQLDAYFAGKRRVFELPLGAVGTAFQRAVWAELARIPYGETRSYGAIAQALGRPTAARAVGAANARNPLSIVVPCHRVVGASGALTGYAGGEARKTFLLALESPVSGRRAPARDAA